MSTDLFPGITASLLAVGLMVLATSAAAAGENGHTHEHGNGHGSAMNSQEGHGNGGDHSFAFGASASPSEADRTVEVEANDQMEFVPEEISVKKGETVRFVVKNVGRVQHSFTLATPDEQQQHEKAMEGMPMDRMASHMDGDPNGVVVQSGETETLTWRFTQAVSVEFACHIPGHYDAGMAGRIRIK